jgi:hypothetical protein
MILGIIFILANVIGASFNFYLGANGSEQMENLKSDSIFLWTLIHFPFYVMTEYIPTIAFGIVMRKYGELI